MELNQIEIFIFALVWAAGFGIIVWLFKKNLDGNVIRERRNVTEIKHLYEVHPRKDHRGFDLISDALPFGRLWYGERNAVSNAVGYAIHHSRSHDAVIRVYDETGNVIETHEHKGDFKEW